MVHGEWDHPIKRNVLHYQITHLGSELFVQEQQKTIEKLRDISSVMKALNHLFKQEENQLLERSEQ